MEVKNGEAYIHVTEVSGCPRRAILKANGEPETDKYYHSQLGTATHRVCEAILKDLIQGVVRPIPEVMDSVAKEYYTEDMFWDSAQLDIMQKVEKLKTWLEMEWDNLKENLEAVEHNIVHPLPRTVGGMKAYLTGTMDILMKDKIIDIKSGKSRSKAHVTQIVAYSLLLGRVMDGEIVYLGTDRFEAITRKNGKVHKYYAREVTKQDVMDAADAFVDELYAYADLLDTHYPNPPEGEECQGCYFCPYRTGCYGESYDGGYRGE